MVTVADNQEIISQELAAAGAQDYLGRSGDVTALKMAAALHALLEDAPRRYRMSKAGMTLVDGEGVSRIVAVMQAFR